MAKTVASEPKPKPEPVVDHARAEEQRIRKLLRQPMPAGGGAYVRDQKTGKIAPVEDK